MAERVGDGEGLDGSHGEGLDGSHGEGHDHSHDEENSRDTSKEDGGDQESENSPVVDVPGGTIEEDTERLLDPQTRVKVYKKRWYVLFVFSLLGIYQVLLELSMMKKGCSVVPTISLLRAWCGTVSVLFRLPCWQYFVPPGMTLRWPCWATGETLCT